MGIKRDIKYAGVLIVCTKNDEALWIKRRKSVRNRQNAFNFIDNDGKYGIMFSGDFIGRYAKKESDCY